MRNESKLLIVLSNTVVLILIVQIVMLTVKISWENISKSIHIVVRRGAKKLFLTLTVLSNQQVFLVSKFAIELFPDNYENFTIRGDVEYVCQASDTLRRAYAVYPIACVQFEYSLFSLDIEKEENGLLKTSNDLEAED
jgi:hypothetical protein